MSRNRPKPRWEAIGLSQERPCAGPTGGRTPAVPAKAQHRDAPPRVGQGSGSLSLWYNLLSAVMIPQVRHYHKFALTGPWPFGLGASGLDPPSGAYTQSIQKAGRR